MNFIRFGSWRNVAFLLVLLFSPWICFSGRGAESSDGFTLMESHDYLMIGNEKRIGRGTEEVFKKGAGPSALWKTVDKLSLSLKRMNQLIGENIEEVVVEDSVGVPKEFHFSLVNSSGLVSMALAGKREGNVYRLSVAGKDEDIPAIPGTLGPASLKRLMKEKMPLKEGAKFVVKAFTADSLQQEDTTVFTVIRKEKKKLYNHNEVDLWLVEEVRSLMPGVSNKRWMDEDYVTWVESLPFPGYGQVELYEVSEKEMAETLEPTEIITSSFIAPTGRMGDDRQSEFARYHLTLPKGEKLNLWNGERQKVSLKSDNEADVEISRYDRDDGKKVIHDLPLTVPDEWKNYVLPNSRIESDQPKIMALAKEAVGDEKNPLVATRKIESFVRHYVWNKHRDSSFSTAMDMAETRSGDCTGHALLVAALCRAVGIPSRVVLGLVHVPAPVGEEKKFPNGAFGFHMWAEAWVGADQWVPLDAALGAYSVTHIAITKDSLAGPNPQVNLSLKSAEMMEGLQIQVQEMK